MRQGFAGLTLAVTIIFLGFPLALPEAQSDPLPRIRIEARGGQNLLVHGAYPRMPSRCLDPNRPVLHGRFQGAIEVGRDDNGSLFVVGELPFEDYLTGIAEMPLSWPMEALKAQAVAARSCALARLGSPDESARHFGYDLCATDACQVSTGSMRCERGGERSA